MVPKICLMIFEEEKYPRIRPNPLLTPVSAPSIAAPTPPPPTRRLPLSPTSPIRRLSESELDARNRVDVEVNSPQTLRQFLMPQQSSRRERYENDRRFRNYLVENKNLLGVPLTADMDRRRKIIFLGKMGILTNPPIGLDFPVHPTDTLVNLTQKVTQFRDTDTDFVMFYEPQENIAFPIVLQWPSFTQEPYAVRADLVDYQYPTQVNTNVYFQPIGNTRLMRMIEYEPGKETYFNQLGEEVTQQISPERGWYGDVVRPPTMVVEDRNNRENRARNYSRYLWAREHRRPTLENTLPPRG